MYFPFLRVQILSFLYILLLFFQKFWHNASACLDSCLGFKTTADRVIPKTSKRVLNGYLRILKGSSYKSRTLGPLTTGLLWFLTCVWCLFCRFLYSWLSMLLFRLLYNWLLMLFFRLLYCWLPVFLARLLYRSNAPAGTILFGCLGIPTDSKHLDKTYTDPLIDSKVDR